jgi:hypothetical protein
MFHLRQYVRPFLSRLQENEKKKLNSFMRRLLLPNIIQIGRKLLKIGQNFFYVLT